MTESNQDLHRHNKETLGKQVSLLGLKTSRKMIEPIKRRSMKGLLSREVTSKEFSKNLMIRRAAIQVVKKIKETN